jgi:hypothetical protein
VIGLMTRFGMDVVLAHPKGYEIMSDVEEVAAKNARESGGSFRKTNSMEEAFEGADIVYPKSWAPYAAMEKRTELYGNNDFDGIKALERELLAQNAQHRDWTCSEEMMRATKDGSAVSALPARGYHGSFLRGGRSRRVGIRPLPRAALPAGKLQALYHRGDDFPCQGQIPAGAAEAARRKGNPPLDEIAGGREENRCVTEL